LFGITRIISRPLYPLEELSIDAGMLYLPVAGVWLVIYRLGIQPFGYGETIILLTVVHFHFAGFAAPIIAGMSGRVLARREYPRGMYAFSVFAIVMAMPLVAAGITFTPVVGLIGALLLTVGLVMLAILTIGWVIPAIGSAGKRSLLVIGALSSCAAMVLACLYAYSLVAHTLILTIPGMALTHGLLNAFGFVGCSLLAYTYPNEDSSFFSTAFHCALRFVDTSADESRQRLSRVRLVRRRRQDLVGSLWSCGCARGTSDRYGRHASRY
jgi:YndJ-like protein